MKRSLKKKIVPNAERPTGTPHATDKEFDLTDSEMQRLAIAYQGTLVAKVRHSEARLAFKLTEAAMMREIAQAEQALDQAKEGVLRGRSVDPMNPRHGQWNWHPGSSKYVRE